MLAWINNMEDIGMFVYFEISDNGVESCLDFKREIYPGFCFDISQIGNVDISFLK